jgi:hypothetical protein
VVRGLVVLLALTGCDALFGVDHVTFDERRVTGTWTRQYVRNNENHIPVIDVRPYAATDATPEAHTIDGTPVEIEWDFATGSFSFPMREGERYRVSLRYAFDFTQELQSTADHLEIVDSFFGRPEPTLAGPTTSLTGTITPTAASTRIVTTGIWTETTVDVAGSYSIPWQRGLLDSREHDRVYAVRFAARGDAYVITAIGTGDIDMVDGVNTLDIPVAPIEPPWCVNVTLQRKQELARITALVPDMIDKDQTAWAIYADPKSDLRPGFLPTLATPTTAAEQVMVKYSTPYAGFETRIDMGVQREIAIASPVAMKRFAGSTNFVAIRDTVTCESYSIPAGLVGFPYAPMIDGVLLVTDGQTIAIGNEPVELTWSLDLPVDELRVALYDVTTGTRVGRAQFVTTQPHVTIAPSFFENGHIYSLQFSGHIGIPNASTGDHATVATTYASTYNSPPLFYVTR